MGKMIIGILTPKYSLQKYEQFAKFCDKFIQIGIFFIVIIQLVGSYFNWTNLNITITILYTILVTASLFYIATFIRYCRCCLQEDIKDINYKESNNLYIFKIFEKLCENVRNIHIIFIIAMYSEKITTVPIVLPLVVFVLVSIPTIITIKNTIIPTIIVLSIILFNSYILYNFANYQYGYFYTLIVVITGMILFFIKKKIR